MKVLSIPEFHYWIGWRSASVHPGYHRSLHTGGGHEFQGYQVLQQAANARHLDLRASLKDPQGQYQVRCFRQSSAITVYLLADVSTSMLHPAKFDTLTRFASSLAWSVFRTGDTFGLLAADAIIRLELCQPPGHPYGDLDAWSTRASQPQVTGHSARGLADLAPHTPHQRSLVFLASDFHGPLSDITHLCQALARHDVVPVVIWEPPLHDSVADYRLACWQEPESGERRRYWMRPALKARFQAAYRERRHQLTDLFLAWGRTPLFLSGAFEADHVTAYFHQGVASTS